MEAEHPIPQEVSTYQFKLVGDMTIQQFFQVAAGALVSLIIYSTNLAGYVRWPLIIISFLVGIAFAFFPIEDRPLSKWLVLFIKAIYSPTVYIWNKQSVRHSFFAPETDGLATQSTQTPLTPPVLNSVAQSQTTPVIQPPQPAAGEFDKLEAKEKEFLNKVNQEFTAVKDQPIIKTEATTVGAVPVKQVSPVRSADIAVPIAQTIQVDKQIETTSQTQPKGDIFRSQSDVGGQVSPIAAQDLASAQTATFSPEAAPPSPPTRPNVIVGQVLDSTGKIIDGAILEIKDSAGRSARALRSNRLGHFMIVTPLSDGDYQILTEKDGYGFDPVTIHVENRIIPPIMIKGKKIVGSQ